jgi:Fe2+ or Zn2+ uptake regulation protein
VADESTKPVAIRLQAAGHRVTRPRLAVVAALRELGGHHTADEVHAHLIRQNTALPRTSVYNSLVLLADLGLVMRADIGPGACLSPGADVGQVDEAQVIFRGICRNCLGDAQ